MGDIKCLVANPDLGSTKPPTFFGNCIENRYTVTHFFDKFFCDGFVYPHFVNFFVIVPGT